jgi:hypothetical protein
MNWWSLVIQYQKNFKDFVCKICIIFIIFEEYLTFLTQEMSDEVYMIKTNLT